MDTSLVQNAKRKVLTAAVSALVYEAGFVSADKASLETLVEILQALISEIGRSSRAFAELASRTEVIVPDIVLALVEMGINVDSIPDYGRLQRNNKLVIPPPAQAPRSKTPDFLSAGEKRPHFSYIPDYLPKFPDPHTYIRTPTHKPPITEYEAIREKSASQKRDVERALTRFMAKTSESNPSHSLFPDDMLSHLFPLIPLKASIHCYLTALLPKDQVFEEDEDEQKDDKKKTEEETANGTEGGEAQGEGDAAAADGSAKPPSDPEIPDNPFLRSPKIVKKRRF